MFNTLMILLADATGAATAPGGRRQAAAACSTARSCSCCRSASSSSTSSFLRPMRKQEQEKAALLNQIKKNDKIITHAGIYGTVVAVSDTEDEITVRVDDNVRLKMVKNSILRNLTNEEAAKEAKAAKDAAKKGAKASSFDGRDDQGRRGVKSARRRRPMAIR